MNSNKSIYKHLTNRPLFLMSCELWDAGERLELPKVCENIIYFSPLFESVPGRGVNVYYNFSDPNQLNFSGLIDYFNNNKSRLLKLEKIFDDNCEKISKITKEKNKDDFEELFVLLVDAWPLMAVSNILGDDSRENIRGVDPDLTDRFFDIRKRSDGIFHFGELALLEITRSLVSKQYVEYADILSFEEVKNGKFPDFDELNKRKEGYIFFEGIVFSGKDLKSFSDENNLEIYKGGSKDVEVEGDQNEIKGKPAYLGLKRGTVKVVFEIKDINKVAKGDVMVAPMTTPDLAVAMRNAGAFVTDEGGITCHAAIVAREMKKPCIIGTKIATQVLRDGDLVEVDADRGVVKILKRAEDK